MFVRVWKFEKNCRIMVMDDGRVAEYDSPDNLLQKPNGIFYGMAKSAKII